MVNQRPLCDECNSLHKILLNCVGCQRRLCRFCVSAAGQCQRCAQLAEPGAMIAGPSHRCPHMGGVVGICISCRKGVCEMCCRTNFLHRPSLVVCVSCQPPPSLVNVCSSCEREFLDDGDVFYCEVCANVICGYCLPHSLEFGVVKCAICCPYPVMLLRNMSIRTQLTDELRSVIVSTSKQQQCKYNELYDHIKLGEGGQGVVYKCRTSDGEVVVSKEMRFGDHERLFYEARLRQAETMKGLSHQHIIQYLHVVGTENPLKINVIMPYYSEGDLSKFISRQRKPVNEHKLCSIALQIATALKYLHTQSPPIVHCDIKPDNVLLLNNEEQVLLMDLDLCHACDKGTCSDDNVLLLFNQASPTFEYRAPEMATSSGSPESDIFSLGVLTFVLATLPEFVMLHNEKGAMSVLSDSDWTKASLARAVSLAIRRHTREYRDDLIELIVDMLRHDPMERPDAAQVISRLSSIMVTRLLNGN
uniref:WGS project CAEQ00000000 data, annotated contig 1735 n=1 Tax=Trypanosoma congolense (strain IL3000) TaxID=1068625 RepID=F9W8G4_TRYCI|nr:unnamed protein product [Trypanosoma congolense IL3000]